MAFGPACPLPETQKAKTYLQAVGWPPPKGGSLPHGSSLPLPLVTASPAKESFPLRSSIFKFSLL